MVGMGGVFVEVFSDVSFRICPIERIDAEEMIADLQGASVLAGARGGPVACTEAIVAALMAIGGAYLPIEPHFPPDRIAAMLTRAGCGLVLTEPGSTTSLDKALDTMSGVEKLLIDDALEEGHGDTDVSRPVAADQLV